MIRWAVKWSSKNKLYGYQEHFMYDRCCPLLFTSRAAAKTYVNDVWGYLRNRPELRKEPHGWRMPKPIKVRVVLKPI